MLDASRCAAVAGKLLDPASRAAYSAGIREEYAAVRRRRRAAGQAGSAPGARRGPREPAEAGLEPLPPRPAHLHRRPGLPERSTAPRRAVATAHRPRHRPEPALSYDLDELTARIDWTPFFRTWELKGTFPGILTDPETGLQATSLHEDAIALLGRIQREGLLAARAVVGLYPANSGGRRHRLLCRRVPEPSAGGPALPAPAVRQGGGGRPNLCLADFVAPVSSGVADHGPGRSWSPPERA